MTTPVDQIALRRFENPNNNALTEKQENIEMKIFHKYDSVYDDFNGIEYIGGEGNVFTIVSFQPKYYQFLLKLDFMLKQQITYRLQLASNFTFVCITSIIIISPVVMLLNSYFGLATLQYLHLHYNTLQHHFTLIQMHIQFVNKVI